MKKEFPPQQWIVDKIISEESVILISAQPASFKTWLVLEISRDVADGGVLLEQFPLAQSSVLILDEESGERQLHKDFKILGVSEKLPIYYSSLTERTLDSKYVRDIIDFCTEHAVKLVVFDSLTRFHNSDENDATAMSQIMSYFMQLKKAGITSLIIHHSRKLNLGNYSNSQFVASNVRGSSDILAACDVHIGISRNGNTISVVQTKNRFNEEITLFTATFNKVDENHSEWKFGKFNKSEKIKNFELEEKIYQIVEDNQGLNQKDIVTLAKQKSPDYSDSNVRNFLKHLIELRRLRTEKGDRTTILYFTTDYDSITEES